jgi:hypothetical protein
VIDPRGRCLFEAALGFLELREHPLRLVVELGAALVERLARVADGRLRLPELLPEFDRERIGRRRRLEDTGAVVAAGTVAAVTAISLRAAAVSALAAFASIGAVAALAAALARRWRAPDRRICGARRATSGSAAAAARVATRRASACRGVAGRALGFGRRVRLIGLRLG